MRYPHTVLLVALSACQTATAAVDNGRAPVTEVVVANQQSASASILSDDGTTMKHVAVGAGPHEAAVSPDGRVAVVTIYGAQTPGNQLAVIDLERDTVIRTIDLATYRRPHGAVFLGNRSDRVIVTSEATNHVVVVDLITGELIPIPTNARASHMIAVTADGTRGWTANVIDNSVSEIDIVNRRFVRSFSVPSRPEGIAVTPDGSEVWVGSNDTGVVSVISTASGTITNTLTGTTFPYRLGASPDGQRMAIVDGQGNRLVIADVASHTVSGTIALDSPRGVSIAPDNRTAWVTLASGQVASVDIVSLVILGTLPVQASPDGVGVGVRN